MTNQNWRPTSGDGGLSAGIALGGAIAGIVLAIAAVLFGLVVISFAAAVPMALILFLAKPFVRNFPAFKLWNLYAFSVMAFFVFFPITIGTYFAILMTEGVLPGEFVYAVGDQGLAFMHQNALLQLFAQGPMDNSNLRNYVAPSETMKMIGLVVLMAPGLFAFSWFIWRGLTRRFSPPAIAWPLALAASIALIAVCVPLASMALAAVASGMGRPG